MGDRGLDAPLVDSNGASAARGYLSDQLAANRGPQHNRHRYAVKAFETYRPVFPADRNIRVLSVGPGDCELEELLVSEGYSSIEIVDNDVEVVENARHRGFVAHLAEDLESFLSERTRAYDVVIMLHVLEHLPKPTIIPTLRRLKAALSTEGLLLVEVPNMGDPFNGLFKRYDDFTHEVGFTDRSLEYVLDCAGFRRVEFLRTRGASSSVVRSLQLLSRSVLRALLIVLSLPNGRQMVRNIDPVISVIAR